MHSNRRTLDARCAYDNVTHLPELCSTFLRFGRSDKEFRNSLVSSVPAIEPVLKVLLQEEGNAVSQATKSINNATQKVIDAKDTVVGFFGSDKPAPAPAPAPAKCMIRVFVAQFQFHVQP